ncbi:extracellular solute-binding protein [Archangium violaceum]|uniref:ABC transporter substrate-binding protein n=1 Tax=Archangium violaceum TaxID=83451 RepID=UPI00194DDE7C|nr:extracellular solute-binding protein [Archangium violaceum]QRN95231.1 extracellular solute-binding protein [Archangium violaceum]
MDDNARPSRRPRPWVLLAVVLITGAVLAALVLSARHSRAPESASTPADSSLPSLRGETFRVLLIGDPFALAIQEASAELEQLTGARFELEVVGYDDVRRMTLRNAQDKLSAYDIVSVDAVWMGEYGERNVLLPLDELISRSRAQVEPEDFLDIAYAQGRYQGRQLGLPIQTHAELLWYREDLLAADGLRPPRTTEELLAVARQYQKPEAGNYGILWNGQRGQPFGQQMAHFYAAFGQPLLDARGRPTLNTPKGVAAARFALELLKVSPPDVVNTAWDQRPLRMARGSVAMTYEWGARTYLVEETPSSVVAGKVGYTAAPHAPGEAAVTPIGTWSLGIPANIGPRRELAWQALVWLTSRETQRLLAGHGSGGMPRKSLLRDPELVRRYPVFSVMDQLGQAGQLQDWMRPAVPQWPQLAEILGTTYHDMLLGRLTPEQAAAQAQQQAEALFPPPSAEP